MAKWGFRTNDSFVNKLLVLTLLLGTARLIPASEAPPIHKPPIMKQNHAKDILLACELAPKGDELEFTYTVENRSESSIYLLDVYPGYDAEDKTPKANFNSVFVCLRESSHTVYFLKGIPPLPMVPVYVRVIPLGTNLKPGSQIKRSFTFKLPLYEQNPWYYQELKHEEYTEVEVHRLVFEIEFLRSTVDGFQAEPSVFGALLEKVSSKYLVEQVEKLTFEMQLNPSVIYRRNDGFNRL